MKVTYNTGKMSVELEGETQRDLFGQLSAFQEVFDVASADQQMSSL